jgi:hypothetical protein
MILLSPRALIALYRAAARNSLFLNSLATSALKFWRTNSRFSRFGSARREWAKLVHFEQMVLCSTMSRMVLVPPQVGQMMLIKISLK